MGEVNGPPVSPQVPPLDLGGSGNPAYRLRQVRHGWFLYNLKDFYIGGSLDRYGEYCEDELRLLLKLVNPDGLIIEAGANIGAHTIPLARHVGPKGAVFAFEPQRIIFQLLCANVALNTLANVATINCGLGAATGKAIVPPVDYRRLNNFGGVSLIHDFDGESVEIHPIDALNLSRCDLIKIDVEGMELAVLQGAARTITQFRPHLYVENNIAERSPALISYLQSLGYRMWWHLTTLMRPDNFFGNPSNMFGQAASCNMICIHARRAGAVTGGREISGPDEPLPIRPPGSSSGEDDASVTNGG